MTQKQEDQTRQVLTAIKTVAFPVLAGFMLWYLTKIDARFEKWETDLQELKINQRVIQRDIQNLSDDSLRMQNDMNELKKSIEAQTP